MSNRCRGKSELSLNQVNSLLDNLAQGFDNDQKKAVLTKMVNSTTVNEQKWLIKVILKDLKIGIGHEVILRSYHKEAVDLYNSTSDLKEVFTQLDLARTG